MLKLALIGTVGGAILGFAGGWRVHDWRDGAAAAKQAVRVIRVVERQAAVSQAAAVRDQSAQDHIRTVTKTLVEKVPVYVSPSIDARYPLPVGFVRLHDAAAIGFDLSAASAGSGGPDDAPSDVAASGAARVIVLNYGACRADQQRLSDLQAWAKAQGLAGG